MNETITLGSTVLLPDGDRAAVTRVGASDAEIEVTHIDWTIGGGPWIFHRSLRPGGPAGHHPRWPAARRAARSSVGVTPRPGWHCAARQIGAAPPP